ncbi:MAG: hypothetical protein ACRDEB_10135 [Chitinophagaceae bacterium]
MKRIILHPLVAVIMVFFVASGNLNSQGLSFTIKLDKSEYTKGEPVSCIMILKNTGAKDLVVNNRFLVNRPSGPHEVSFQITDQDMNMIPFSAKVNASRESKEFIILHPGQGDSATYLLSKRFTMAETGVYYVEAYYENRVDPPGSLKMASSWKGDLKSNKIIFTLR